MFFKVLTFSKEPQEWESLCFGKVSLIVFIADVRVPVPAVLLLFSKMGSKEHILEAQTLCSKNVEFYCHRDVGGIFFVVVLIIFNHDVNFRPANLLKRDSSASVFLWILKNFYGRMFPRTPPALQIFFGLQNILKTSSA